MFSEERPCEGISRGRHLQPKRDDLEDPKPADTFSWTFRPKDYEKMNFYCLSHPVCGILLLQP